jgi:hypothetical protein
MPTITAVEEEWVDLEHRLDYLRANNSKHVEIRKLNYVTESWENPL